MKQGTPEWHLARCGRATASEFASILAKGEGKTRTKYLRRIVTERLTGKPTDTYHNAHMDRGQEQEPLARMAYEMLTDNVVEEVGFIAHPEMMAGCSPDGLIGVDGGAEIKSVIPTVQTDTILGAKLPSEHRAQIQGCMWITGRKWWDFCSFSPDMPANLRLYVLRVERDKEYIENLQAEVLRFLADAESLYAQLMGRQA